MVYITDKFDEGYNRYLCMKWDLEHNTLAKHLLEEYERLKEKFGGVK